MELENNCYLEIIDWLNSKKVNFAKMPMPIKSYYGVVHFVGFIPIDNNLDVVKNRDKKDDFEYPKTPDDAGWDDTEFWAKTNSYKFYAYLRGLAKTPYYCLVKKDDFIVGLFMLYNYKKEPLKNKHQTNVFFINMKRAITIIDI